MKWLTFSGCAVLLLASGLIAAIIHAMGLSKYVATYFQFLLALVSSPDALPANWVDVQADIVAIEHRTDQNYRDLATLTLRYPGASGQIQSNRFEVYSASRNLLTLRSGNRVAISVCRGDPSVIKSNSFLLSDDRTCTGDEEA